MFFANGAVVDGRVPNVALSHDSAFHELLPGVNRVRYDNVPAGAGDPPIRAI